jgi:cytoskeletal protein RodZ
MARTQGKKRLIAAIVVLGIVLLIVGVIVVAKNVSQKPATKTTDTSKTSADITKDASTTETDTTDPSTTNTTASPSVDPATLTSIDVQPLGIAVSYTKGVGAFNFEVKKTADQTQYVEFSSTDLAGTKCTDDNGLFASIIKNPSSSEVQATITQTVKVGNDTYGLSLAGKGCTSNPDLLDQYQTAFTNGFPSLKAL